MKEISQKPVSRKLGVNSTLRVINKWKVHSKLCAVEIECYEKMNAFAPCVNKIRR